MFYLRRRSGNKLSRNVDNHFSVILTIGTPYKFLKLNSNDDNHFSIIDDTPYNAILNLKI